MTRLQRAHYVGVNALGASVKITDFLVMDTNGDEISADAFGNNLAFNCWVCSHPVLAIALENQRGSDEDHLAVCRGCGTGYFLDVRSHAEKLYVHSDEAL